MVKNNLTESGFNHVRVEGFSDKRHMLKGKAVTQLKRRVSNNTVAVIGSGIAGCILSYTLAKKGINVDLFEKSDQICSGASLMNYLLPILNFLLMTLLLVLLLFNHISLHVVSIMG